MMNKELLESLSKDRSVRQAVTKESHLMFFHVYFSNYVKYEIAEFQKDIFRITEDQSNKLACIVAFRGSGKSTLVTFSYSLWSILGVQQKKFVVIICKTQAQAKQHMTNLRHELENNKVLMSDLGPFQEETNGEWAMSSLVFKNTGARIMIASTDQSIRGIRHHEHRPDLIILDDVEDLNSARTLEGRNKVFDWFTREVIPLGDIGTRIILVGNLLHEDSLMMRLKKKIDKKELNGVFHWFPLLDEDGKCLWPGKFDSKEKIEDLRKSVANELAWQQEYLLNIISDSTRVVFPEWIKYYDESKPIHKKGEGTIYVGVDLAISEKNTGDYTGMVSILLKSDEGKMKIYVLPNQINKRMSCPDACQTMHNIRVAHKNTYGLEPNFIIENNGFQDIYVQAMVGAGASVKGIRSVSDKRSKLALTSNMIREGMILFPKNGSEDLVTQITGLGIENHDDLSDAFVFAVLETFEEINSNDAFKAWLDWMDEYNGGSAWI